MPAEVLVISILAVVACIALATAIMAVWSARKATRRLAQLEARQDDTVKLQGDERSASSQHNTMSDSAVIAAYRVPATRRQRVNTVTGRVVANPSNKDVVEATMGRPLVRFSTLAYGVAYALRPQSRDRIIGLMRREYKQRRKSRLRMSRRAARMPLSTHPSAQTTHPCAQTTRPSTQTTAKNFDSAIHYGAIGSTVDDSSWTTIDAGPRNPNRSRNPNG